MRPTLNQFEKNRPNLHAVRCLLVSACIGLAPFSGTCAAETEIPENRFELSGFGTLGVAQTDTNQVRFIRDQTQPDGIGKTLNAKTDSLIGLQAYFRATDSLEFITQAISRYGPHGDYRPEISWAFAKYALNGDKMVARAGRLGIELYMLADSRHVGYSYLTVRPPVDFFGLLAFHHLDGADLVGTMPIGEGVLKIKGFAGQANEKAPIGDNFLNLSGNPMYGMYADYQEGHWQWRATYAQMTFKHDLPIPQLALLSANPSTAAIAKSLALTDTTSRFYSLGAVYDKGPLLVQAMLSQVEHESHIYQNVQAGYLITGYRLGELTPFAAYSWSKSESRHLPSFLEDIQARVHTDQHTYTLGSRWDFRRNAALKAQVDFIRGKPESVFLYPNANPGLFDGKMNVYSLALDFVF